MKNGIKELVGNGRGIMGAAKEGQRPERFAAVEHARLYLDDGMRNILAVSVLGLQTDSVQTAEALALASSKEKRELSERMA